MIKQSDWIKACISAKYKHENAFMFNIGYLWRHCLILNTMLILINCCWHRLHNLDVTVLCTLISPSTPHGLLDDIHRDKGVVNIYGQGTGWNRGAVKYFGEIREAQPFWRFTGEAVKAFWDIQLQICLSIIWHDCIIVGHENVLCIQGGRWATNIFWVFESTHDTFYHHGTFQPLLSAIIVDNSLRRSDKSLLGHFYFINNIELEWNSWS